MSSPRELSEIRLFTDCVIFRLEKVPRVSVFIGRELSAWSGCKMVGRPVADFCLRVIYLIPVIPNLLDNSLSSWRFNNFTCYTASVMDCIPPWDTANDRAAWLSVFFLKKCDFLERSLETCLPQKVVISIDDREYLSLVWRLHPFIINIRSYSFFSLSKWSIWSVISRLQMLETPQKL